MQIRSILATLVLAALPAGAAWATDYYVAPKGATLTCDADGTEACPFATVDQVFAAGKLAGGDTLLLLDGDHGALTLANIGFASPVTITSLNGKNAQVQSIRLGSGARNLTLRNLQVWESDPHRFHDPFQDALILTDASTSGILFDGLDVRAGQDAGAYMTWSRPEWLSRAVNGAILEGAGNVIRHSAFIGIRFGIQLLGPDGQAVGNLIDGFSGDGINANGDNDRILGNQVTNCISVDDNHADGFQSFTFDQPVKGLDIEGNVFIEWAHVATNPLRCTMQGIGLFDGYYDNLTIRNNIVVATAWHGIAVYGGRRAVIENNTVVNNDGAAGQAPWITVQPLKSGAPSTDVIVANNLGMSFGKPGGSVRYFNNSVLIRPNDLFQDFWAFNLVPRGDSGFVDTGEAAFAPPLDILGARRPAGKAPDRGAYEVGAKGGRLDTPGAGIGLGVVSWGSFIGGN